MRSAARLLACVAVAALFAATLSLPALGEIYQGNQREKELDEVCQAFARRNAAKTEVTGELLAGRIALREAVDRFRAINEASPAAAGRSDSAEAEDGSACRQVLAWAGAHAEWTYPERAEELMARLEGEARDFLIPR
jgi:hypothetical protein